VLFEKIAANWPPVTARIFVIAAHGLLRRAAVHRRADGLFWRPPRPGQHGGGPLDADAVRHAERPAGHTKRRAAHGRRGGLLVVLSTQAAVSLMVVLYSINVFITFSLSQLGMVRHWWLVRTRQPKWKSKLFINGLGLLLTGSILICSAW
jgi:hypothetical protein